MVKGRLESSRRIKIKETSVYTKKMGDAVDVTFDGLERCCNGCQIMKGGENTLHKTGGRRNPNRK